MGNRIKRIFLGLIVVLALPFLWYYFYVKPVWGNWKTETVITKEYFDTPDRTLARMYAFFNECADIDAEGRIIEKPCNYSSQETYERLKGIQSYEKSKEIGPRKERYLLELKGGLPFQFQYDGKLTIIREFENGLIDELMVDFNYYVAILTDGRLQRVIHSEVNDFNYTVLSKGSVKVEGPFNEGLYYSSYFVGNSDYRRYGWKSSWDLDFAVEKVTSQVLETTEFISFTNID